MIACSRFKHGTDASANATTEYTNFANEISSWRKSRQRVNPRERPWDFHGETRFPSKIIVSTSLPCPLLKRHEPPSRAKTKISRIGMESRISTVRRTKAKARATVSPVRLFPSVHGEWIRAACYPQRKKGEPRSRGMFRAVLRSDRRTWRPRSRTGITLAANDHSSTYLGVPRRVVVVNKGGHPRAWQQQHNFHISPHLCLRACQPPVSPLSCLRPAYRPRSTRQPPPRLLRPRFHARCLARRKRSTHTRRRLRTVTPWIDATNANEPAAEAILSGSDENGCSAIALNAPPLPNPRARRRVERRCDAHWPLWRRISNYRQANGLLSPSVLTPASVLCWPLYATRCNMSTIFRRMGKMFNGRERKREINTLEVYNSFVYV